MRFRNLASLSLAFALAPTIAFGQTIQTFEDYSPCDNTLNNVGQYGPVNYQNMWTCYGFDQPPYNAHSGTNRVYVDVATLAGPFSFTSGPVVFDGAWFSGIPTTSVQFELFLGVTPVWTSGILFTSDVPTFLSSGYSGLVDNVRVVSNSPRTYIMDDVTFNTSTAVPEPASLTLLGTGLVGLYGIARRRRNRAA